METKIIYLIVFFSQIILLSYYFPRKTSQRIKNVLDEYPPDLFPKLYPMSIEYYKIKLRNFKILNTIIFSIGIALLIMLAIYFPDDSQKERWEQAVTFAYFMAQFFPLFLLEISSFNIYKAMRQINSSSQRKAELRPRKILDFISLKLLILVIGVYVGFILFILYFNQFNYSGFGGTSNIWVISGGNLFFIGIIVWSIYGKKLDPYIAAEDRRKQISNTVNQLAIISIIMTLYTVIYKVTNVLDLRHFGSTLMSIYFQLIGVISLQALSKSDINFDVYKNDSQTT